MSVTRCPDCAAVMVADATVDRCPDCGRESNPYDINHVYDIDDEGIDEDPEP